MLWSATWPKEVQAIAKQFLTDPYKVTIGSPELKANHSIRQHFEFPQVPVIGLPIIAVQQFTSNVGIQEHEKFRRLLKLLEREMDGSRILVFCETKRGCDEVTRQLRTEGWPALSIHGDKSQLERDWVLAVPTWVLCAWTLKLSKVSKEAWLAGV